MTCRLRLVVALFLGILAGVASAGSIVGSNYVSETDGVIEVAADGWNIMDTEKTPIFPNHIARFFIQRQLKGGTLRPFADFFRLANPGGQVQPQAFLQEIAQNMSKVPGMTVSPISSRQFGGRTVLALPATMKVKDGTSHGVIYVMHGEKSIYWAQLFAHQLLWDEARTVFDQLMENVKY